MIALRHAIGLSQVELSQHLGVSREAVGRWERGIDHINISHLKAITRLAMDCRAFTEGQEAEEITAFWKAAHRAGHLTSMWLTEVLGQEMQTLSPHVEICIGGQWKAGRIKQSKEDGYYFVADDEWCIALRPGMTLRIPEKAKEGHEKNMEQSGDCTNSTTNSVICD